MKENIKAALLSALVLPGLGQIYKGRRVKGFLMVFLVNLFLLGALVLVLKGTGTLFISARAGGVDAATLLEALRSETPAARWLLAAFFCLWIYGVADALFYRGKRG